MKYTHYSRTVVYNYSVEYDWTTNFPLLRERKNVSFHRSPIYYIPNKEGWNAFRFNGHTRKKNETEWWRVLFNASGLRLGCGTLAWQEKRSCPETWTTFMRLQEKAYDDMLLFYSQQDMKAGKANSTIYFLVYMGMLDKVTYHMVVIFGIEINSAEVFAEVAGIYIPNQGF